MPHIKFQKDPTESSESSEQMAGQLCPNRVSQVIQLFLKESDIFAVSNIA